MINPLELIALANPPTSIARYGKLILVGILVVAALLVGLHIYTLTKDLEHSEAMLAESNKRIGALNQRIEDQNKSIRESNAKFEAVQKLIAAATQTNNTITKEFEKIRKDIKDRPVPATCEESRVEMIEYGRKLGAKWKK